MNHDYAHCLDYVQGVCPSTCLRAELTEDYQKHHNMPVSWMHFEGTSECEHARKKPTHADRIRQMTVEELAEFFGTLPCCPPGEILEELCFPNSSCEGTDLQAKCWLNWLKQEVDV